MPDTPTTRQGIVTIGIDVKIDGNALNYVTDIGDIGGTPNQKETTCMKDTMQHNVPGVQQGGSIEITYWFDNTSAQSDFRRLKAIPSTKSVPIVFTFPDAATESGTGTTATASGLVSTMVTGLTVDSLIQCKTTVSLDKDWVWTDPT